ncbi:hypothetical protein PIB30_076427, partial [Stylosanthes scabra]|nr:hypothetical protein [Stylosanthes scabra]
VTFGLGASEAPNVTNNTKGASSLAFSPSRLEHQTPNVNHDAQSQPQVTFSTPKREPLAPPNMTSSMPSKSRLAPFSHTKQLIIHVDESILDPCGFQIQQRKWERFTKPIQAVGHLMVKEFYANAWELDKEKRKPYTYTTMVRGKDISFAPSNIKRVLKLRKDPLPNAASYHERKANKDYRLEHVLEDLCIEGADWVRHKGQKPYYLRRANLEPMTKGQFKEMEMQGIPVTMANLAIHRQKEEEMNQERMRYEQILQEAAVQQAREANKGKAREVCQILKKKKIRRS